MAHPRLGWRLWLLPLLLAGGVLPTSSLARATYRVTVTRDAAGVAHITASDFGSLGYGQGYSFAQDNLCVFAEDVVTLRGQRTRYFGAAGVAANYANDARDPNPVSDLYWTEVRSNGRIAQLARGVRPEVAAVFRGWAAGYNAWLRSRRFRDPSCRGKPWVTPITAEDLYLRGYQFQTFPSSSALEAGIVGAQPPAVATATATRTVAPARLDPLALQRMFGGGSDPGIGSNAIGVGSRGTRRGIAGMVLANPHFPWRGPERLWLMQLDVPGQYDMFGGTLFGFPLVGVGFNRHVAFTSTNATGFRFVPIQLQLVPGDPTGYLVDGHRYTMTRRVVRAVGRTHTFYFTRFGPVFDLPRAGYTWTRSTAYALFDADAQMLASTANQYFDMGRVRSVRELLAVLRRYLSNPEFNITAADDRGETLYANVGAYPGVTRELAARCIPSGLPQLVYQQLGLITLDGSRSACGLRSDPAAPRSNILGPRSLPATIRRDWVENSNDSYWLANPHHPFGQFSPILGPYQTPQLFRTRQGNLMIEARLAGADGLGPRDFDIATMQRMLGRFGNYGGALVTRQLAAACDAHPVITLPSGMMVDVRAACPILRAYRGTGRLDDPGAWLFTTWLLDIPTGFPWLDRFDPANPLNTPRVLDPSAPDTLNSLAEAVAELRAHHIPLSATLRQVQYTLQTGHRTPIAGCFGCYETIDASHARPIDLAPYGRILFGDSLIMFTELRRSGPVSQGTLTYSQATDPTSPWHANLTRLYARGRYVPLPYTAAALRAERGTRTLRLVAPR